MNKIQGILLLVMCTCFTGCPLLNQSTRIIMPSSLGVMKQVTEIPAIEILEEQYGKYDGVYISSFLSDEHIGGQKQPPWIMYRSISRQYVILNPEAENMTTFKLTLPKGAKVEQLTLRYTNPGQQPQTHRYKRANLSESKDEQVYSYIYPKAEKGTVIEETFILSFDAQKVSPFLDTYQPLQFPIPCEKLTYKFAYPDWWRVRVKELGENKTLTLDREHNVEGKKRVITYQATNVGAFEDELYSPYFQETADYLRLNIEYFEMLGFRSTQPVSWFKLMKQIEKSIPLTTDYKPGSRIDLAARNVTRDANTPEEKINAILSLIQRDIKVDGEKTENYKLEKVLASKKGNVLQVVGLMHAMARAVGLDAYFIMTRPASRGYFDEDYISFEELSVPAVLINTADKSYLTFPYQKIPYDVYPSVFEGQIAYQIQTRGQLTTAKFVTLDNLPTQPASIREKYILNINEDGIISVNETKIIDGFSAVWFRTAIEDLTEDEVDEMIQNMLTYDAADITVNTYEINDRDDYLKPITINLEYEIDNLVTVTPEEILFQTAGLFAPASGKRYKIDTSERKMPIKIRANHNYSKDIEISFPDSW